MQLFRVVQALWVFFKLKTVVSMSSHNLCTQYADMNRRFNPSGVEIVKF